MLKRMKFALLTFYAFLMMGCAHTVEPDLGEAPAAAMPALPPVLAEEPEPLPPMTADSLEAHVLDGIETDAKYAALSARYLTLVKAWGCVRQALAERDDEGLQACLR